MGTSIHALPQIPASVLPLPQVPETTAELPSAPVSVHPLPSTPETTLALPTAGVTLLPAGFVPYFPPELAVEATGEGTATAAVSGSLTAEATASSEGASSTDLLPIQYLAADVAGAGDSSAEVTTAESITVDVSSEGTSSVDLAVRIDADASGSGSSSVDTAVRIDANTSGSGNSGAEVTLVGVLMPNVSGEGTSSVELKTFNGSGMYRTGSAQQLPNFGGEAQITGWSPDTSLFPGSTVISNDLVIQDDGDGITIEASIWFNTSTSRTLTVRMLLDGVQIATNGGYTGTGSRLETLTVTGLTVAEASRVRVVASTNIGNSWSVSANPASYVRVFKP